jgi:hypothetical protein
MKDLDVQKTLARAPFFKNRRNSEQKGDKWKKKKGSRWRV